MSGSSSDWLRSTLSALYTGSDSASNEQGDVLNAKADDFDQLFNTAFSPSASISVNDEAQSLDQVKDGIASFRPRPKGSGPSSALAISRSSIEFGEIVETESRTLKGTYTLTRTLPFRVRAAPMQTRRVVNFEAKISPTSGAQGQSRQITSLVEHAEDAPVPIHLHPGAQHDVDKKD